MGMEIVQTMAVNNPFSGVTMYRCIEEEYWQRPEARYFRLRERLVEMDI
jgi:hypothetical protein